MIRKSLFAVAALAGLLQSVSAVNLAIIDFSGAIEAPVVSQSGATLANGSGSLSIGYLTSTSASVLSVLSGTDKAATVAALAANFVPLGLAGGDPDLGSFTAATGPRLAQRTVGGVSKEGRLIGGITGVNVDAAAAANTLSASGVPLNTRLVLLVWSGATADASNELGIFSADTWLMPTAATPSLQLNATAVDTAAEIYRGSLGSLKLQSFGAVIPEPTTTVSGLLALGALMARRRRA